MLKNLNASLEDWLEYIEQIHPKEIDFGLDRILTVAQPTAWHQFTCPVVTITGTNGKGSCVRFLENIFSEAGYRVGAYTSPHLMCFNERIRVANQMVDNQTLLTAFRKVEQQRNNCSLSFFEFTFLSALVVFQQANLDLIILEVGVGGRLDAVNIVDADIAVITTIGLDHTNWLGPDRSAIAKEKAGIFRSRRLAVCGDTDPPDNLYQVAQKLDVKLFCMQKDFFYHKDESTWEWQGINDNYQELPSLSLKHQNAATSLMVVELLQKKLPVPYKAVYQGLKQSTLAGRFEKINLGRVSCYLDVGHNPQASTWIAHQWKNLPKKGRRVAVIGILSDKDIAGTLSPLLLYVDSWYVATLSVSRGAKAEQLLEVLKAFGAESCYHFSTVDQALKAAIADLSLGYILVFGSFYTVAAARQYLLHEESIYEGY